MTRMIWYAQVVALASALGVRSVLVDLVERHFGEGEEGQETRR
jgi:hypothetical protein